MEKTTDMSGRLKFWLPQNLLIKAKIYAADRSNNLELLILVLDFKVDYKLKTLEGISVECMECLNEDV